MGNVVRLKTKDIKPREGELIKPAELIGIIGAEHWTLTDKLVWAALLKWAWGDRLANPAADFTVPLAELRDMTTPEDKHGHDSSDRIKESVLTIMRTVVKANTPNRPNSTRMVGLLSGLDIDNNVRDGVLTYSFDKRLIPILRNSDIYARMELKVMAAFTSKYSVALYEVIALRGGLKARKERLSLGQLRMWLGIPDDKLSDWYNLNTRAIAPAVKEINSLSPFSVSIAPLKRGRTVTHVDIRWDKKLPLSPDEQKAAQEVNRHKAGRKERLSGVVERIAMPDAAAITAAKDILSQRGFDRFDVYSIQSEWVNVVRQMEFKPANLDDHWLAYCRAWNGK